LRYLSPLLFVAIRLVACAVVLRVLIILPRQSWRPLAGWKWLHCAVAGALLNAIGLMAPHVGLLTAPAAQIALAAIFGIMLLHERLRMGQWLGLVLGVTGVALVVGEAAVESVARFQGLVLAFVGVLGLVAGTLYFGRFCRGVPLLPGATAQFLSAAAVASLGAWLWKRLMRIGRGLLSQPLLGTPSWFLFQTNRGNLHVDGSLHVIRLRRTTLWHFNAGSGRRPPPQ
jgi:drug/metabolite transporter (DMT)-like permease